MKSDGVNFVSQNQNLVKNNWVDLLNSGESVTRVQRQMFETKIAQLRFLASQETSILQVTNIQGLRTLLWIEWFGYVNLVYDKFGLFC